jgi:hypothetical protein
LRFKKPAGVETSAAKLGTRLIAAGKTLHLSSCAKAIGRLVVVTETMAFSDKASN